MLLTCCILLPSSSALPLWCRRHSQAGSSSDPFPCKPACQTSQPLSSAGGSAKQARDRRFQAILPLRGKILNVERQDDASLYKNNEISNLIVGLGLGLKGEASPNLRYGKVSC